MDEEIESRESTRLRRDRKYEKKGKERRGRKKMRGNKVGASADKYGWREAGLEKSLDDG